MDPSFRMRYKFLFIKFRPDVWWWSMVMILKGIVLNFGFAVLTEGIAQIYWVMTFIAVYCGACVNWMPWRHRLVNVVDITTHMILLFSCSMMTWFCYDPETYERRSDDFQTLLAVLLHGPLLIGGGIAP